MSGRDRDLARASRRLLRQPAAERAANADGAAPWDARYFGLEGVAQFLDSSAAQRRAVLDACSAGVLAESWFIERCGIEFCAKMTLAAETLEERRLFALIGADEAAHSAWLEPWMPPSEREPDAFNRFVAGLVASGRAEPLSYLMQVVLEGFGMVHYAGLAARCSDVALAATLARMAQDEALHHAGGLAAFRADRLDRADRRFLADASVAFLGMIRNGPQSVVAALDAAVGLGPRTEVAAVFTALDAPAGSAAKLAKLRKLMAQPGMAWLLDELDAGDLFAPCSAEQCARLYCESR